MGRTANPKKKPHLSKGMLGTAGGNGVWGKAREVAVEKADRGSGTNFWETRGKGGGPPRGQKKKGGGRRGKVLRGGAWVGRERWKFGGQTWYGERRATRSRDYCPKKFERIVGFPTGGSKGVQKKKREREKTKKGGLRKMIRKHPDKIQRNKFRKSKRKEGNEKGFKENWSMKPNQSSENLTKIEGQKKKDVLTKTFGGVEIS